MHDRVSFNSLCFPGADMATIAGHWRDLGARTISFLSPQLLDGDVGAIAALIAENGYRVETLTHIFHPGPLPVRGDDAGDARARLCRLIDIAASIGARSIYMLTGGRGAMPWEQAAEAFAAAIAPCVAYAEAAGIALSIENAPFLYADIHLAHSLRDTITLAEVAGIGVCIDLFGCWTEAGFDALLDLALPRTVLIQVSDHVLGDRSLPSRAVPGDGAIPLRHILGRALAGGYAGSFDLELLGPRIDQEGRFEAVRRAGLNVSELLRELGA
jgi:sugar phosphate isomerase/epimerase